MTEAAERFDKAARAGYAKVARGTSRSYELRATAGLVRLMGHISADEDTFALLALVLDLARLGDTLAWRRSQDAWHQAEAARDAAEALRTPAARRRQTDHNPPPPDDAMTADDRGRCRS